MNSIINYFRKSLLLWVIFLLLLVFLSNYVLSVVNLKLDTTEDKTYSLSSNTKKFLTTLTKNTEITYYFSKSHHAAPITIINFGERIYNSLTEIAAASKGKITIKVIDPQPDSDEEQWAVQSNVIRNVIDNAPFFIGAVLSSGKKEIIIPLFDPSREQFVEYDIARKLYELTVDKKSQLAILSGTSMKGFVAGQGNLNDTFFISELKKTYGVTYLDHKKLAVVPENIDLLLILHPKEFSETTEYAIDQFLMRGGNLMVLFDPFFRFDDTIKEDDREINSSSLKRLFAKWGVNNNNGNVVGDRKFATIVNAGNGQQVPYPFWIHATKDALKLDSPISSNIGNAIMVEAGAFRVKKSDNWKYTSLLHTSNETGFTEATRLKFSDALQVSKYTEYNEESWDIMGVFDGTTDSAFEKAPDVSADLKTDATFDLQLKNRPAHLATMQKKARVLLISDMDFIVDRISISVAENLGQKIVQFTNDNYKLFQSALDNLFTDNNLALIEPKTFMLKTFTKFDKLQKDAQDIYQQKEGALQLRLDQLSLLIKSIKPDQATSQIDLTPEALKKIKDYQTLEVSTKQELRNIRKLLREKVEVWITYLTILNLFAVPIAMTGLGVFVYLKRGKRKRV